MIIILDNGKGSLHPFTTIPFSQPFCFWIQSVDCAMP